MKVWIYNETSTLKARIRHEPNDEGEYADAYLFEGTVSELTETANGITERAMVGMFGANDLYMRHVARSIREACLAEGD